MADLTEMQIRKVDGGLLLVFRELLRRRRATQVADHLGLSPSAISHALTRMRDVFGDPLFIRRSHGLEPTQRAIELGPRIEALIDAIGLAVSNDAAFDPTASRRRFRIACPDEVASLIGDRLVEMFRREAPRANVSMRRAVLDSALRAVRRGEADVAIGVFDQVQAGFKTDVLYEDEYCVIARADHPTIGDAVDPYTYGAIGHVFVGNPDGALADEAPLDREALAQAYGTMPGPEIVRTNAYVNQWETAMLIVSGSDVLADCPKRLASRFAGRLGLKLVEAPFAPFRFTVRTVRRADTPDPGLDWLLGRLAESVAG